MPPQKGFEFPGGWGGSVRPKNLKKCMKLNWNFQRGWVVLEKIPSVGEVWIFSGITQYVTYYMTALTERGKFSANQMGLFHKKLHTLRS